MMTGSKHKICSTTWHIVALVLILLGSGACQAEAGGSPIPTPEPNSNILLDDDFSSPNQNWVRFDTPDGAIYDQEGELFLEDRGGGIAMYSPLLNQTWDDIVIDTKVRQVQGSVNNWIGVMCRQRDEENYYLFAISADGYYLILRVLDGVAQPLAGPAQSNVIRKGRTTNQLQARCYSTHLSLRINSTLVETCNDQNLEEGHIAVFADAVESGRTTVAAFDYITLSKP